MIVLIGCSEQKKDNSRNETLTEAPDQKAHLQPGLLYSSLSGLQGNQQYALYLPSTWKESVQMPAFIFFDPHAEGSYPLSLYKGLAEHFGVILMGSNNSENGLTFEQTDLIAGHLINEAILRFHADPQTISLAGFSGGAKAALAAASQHREIASVLYCGAAFPPGSIRTLPPSLGFAGLQDMNYTEVVTFYSSLDSIPVVHALEEWNGKHSWPDSSTFLEAFIWSQIIHPVDSSTKQKLYRQYLSAKEKKLNSRDVLVREKTLKQAIVFLNGSEQKNKYVQALEKLAVSPELRSKKNSELQILTQENQAKEQYIRAFDSAPLSWWESEVKRLRSHTGDDSNQRLLGYISLAAYSFSNNALKQNNLPGAERALAIYEIADPENAEQPFLAAVYYAKQNDPDKAIASLKKSIQKGLKKRSKIETEPAFSSLLSRSDFNELMDTLQ